MILLGSENESEKGKERQREMEKIEREEKLYIEQSE
jgi:hypothetical protein